MQVTKTCVVCGVAYTATRKDQTRCPTHRGKGYVKRRVPGDKRNTYRWRQLVRQVVREEPTCWLRYPRICTGASQTADHIVPVVQRPDLQLERANLRGACHPCNTHRGDRPPPPITDTPPPPHATHPRHPAAPRESDPRSSAALRFFDV